MTGELHIADMYSFLDDDQPVMISARAKAWQTRRAKYGDRGHAGAYRRPTDSLGRRALALVIRLHHEETLSEGQCCKALDLDRVAFRELVDGWLNK